MLMAEDLWSPAITNWFPGITKDRMNVYKTREILAMYRFIASNSQDA